MIQTVLASLLLLLPLQMPDVQAQIAEITEAAEEKESPASLPQQTAGSSSKPSLPPPPPKPVRATTAPQTIPQQIRSVFGSAGPKAVAVSWCESRHQTTATNGQYRGLFQMGARERARFGHGPDALTQIRAAYAYFILSGWSPWKACL